MKNTTVKLFAAATICAALPLFAQNQTTNVSPVIVGGNLPYSISVSTYDMGLSSPSAIQSFIKANVGDDWLLISGRTNGLHNFTNSGILNFPPDKQNTVAYVIDPVTKQVWSRSLSDPSSGLSAEQIDELSTTAAQGAQQGNSLYVVGGYGYDHTSSTFKTFDTLTSINVSQAISWVQGGGGTLASTMLQTSDPLLRVTGGSLQLMNGRANLIFGQNFDGGYDPTVSGSYTDQVRSFNITSTGTAISLTDVSTSAPNPDNRRRDLNIVPIMTHDGTQQGAVALSGVFTTQGGAWTVPVEIAADGSTSEANPNDPSTFLQGMNGYKTTSITLFSQSRNQSHILLLGGISLEYYNTATGTIALDNNLPFINSMSSIVRSGNGTYTQYYLGELPSIPNPGNNNAPYLFGAESELLASSNLYYLPNGMIDMDTLSASTPTVLGYMFGGIAAVQANFGSSGASDQMFAVTYTPSPTIDLAGQNLTVGSLSGGNPTTISNSSTTSAVLSVGKGLTNVDAFTYDGLIENGAGTVGLNLLAGSLTLTNHNTYTGGTMVSGGTLVAGNDTAFGTGDLTMNGGTLDLHGFNVSFGNLSGASGTITSSGGLSMLTINETQDPIYAGTITGPLAVTYNGTNASNLVLTGANSYTGGTTITGGTVVAGSTTAFGTGNLNLTGGTLTIGTTPSGTLHVGGNYVQGPGGTLVLTISGPAVYNTLTVGGTAQLGGALVVNLQGGYAPGAGQTFNLIQATGGITGQFSSVTDNISTLPTLVSTLNFVNSGGVLTGNFVLQQLPFAPYAQTPNQASVANYIDTHDLGAMTPGFSAVVAGLNNSSTDPSTLANAFDQLSPEKFGNFARSTAFNNATFTTQQFDSYVQALRSPQGTFTASDGGLNTSGLSMISPNVDPGLSQIRGRLLAFNPSSMGPGLLSDSGDAVLGGVDMKSLSIDNPVHSNPWDVFVQGNVILSQDYAQADLAHADSTTGAVQLGASYRISPHWLAGALFGYGHTHATLDSMGSNATVNSYAPGIFASYANKGWYANALGSYGFNNFSESRAMNFGGFTGTANGSPNGSQEVANVDGGYDFHAKEWTLGPTIGVQYTHFNIDSFTESGVPGANLQVSSQDSNSVRSRLGGHVSYAMKCGSTIFTPHLDASWLHEYLDQSRGITSQFTSVGAGSFTVNTPNPSRDSALVDVGLDAQVNGQVSVFADYMAQAGQSNYFGQSIQAGVKIGF